LNDDDDDDDLTMTMMMMMMMKMNVILSVDDSCISLTYLGLVWY
jgi:hypothetical protein